MRAGTYDGPLQDGMQVSSSEHDGIAILTLTGEFDSFETDLVRAGFEDLLREGHTRVVFDLGPLTFANSTTIAYFITAQRNARAQKGEVALAGPHDIILKALTTLGLQQVFPICDDVETAVAHLKSRAQG